MAKIVLEEWEEYPVLPADSIIHVKIDDVTMKEVEGKNGSWQKLEFKFKILGIQVTGDASNVDNYATLVGGPIWGQVPARFSMSPENRLRQWVEAIYGMELEAGFELDTDLLVGREVRAVTSTYDKRSINPRTGQPFKQHQVDSLLKKAMATAGAPAPTQEWNDTPPF